jgi:hypothetical protein
MASRTYVEKIRQVTADQFLVAVTPWPAGVDACDRMPGIPHFHYPNDTVAALDEGDWIVTERRNGYQSIMADSEFTETFNTAPPAPETQPI